MKREELKALFTGVEGDFGAIIDSILDMNGRDINSLKAEREKLTKELTELKAIPNDTETLTKQLDDLQKKYDTDTKALQSQLSERNYSDAVNAAIAEHKIKFSSKAAESYFKSQLNDKRLEIADGKLKGFDEFYKAIAESDASAFVTEDQQQTLNKPHFLTGAGGSSQVVQTAAQAAAARFNAKFAKSGGESK